MPYQLKFLIFCLLVIVHVQHDAVAQRGQPNFGDVVDAVVESEMKRQNIVGASVAFISKSRIVFSRGYGLADVDSRIPFSDETVLNWASNSKPVMAVLAMQLVEQGKLNLDAPISNYMPQLPGHLHAITPRQLLCHQSGIPHYSNGKIVRSKSYDSSANEFDPEIALQRFVNSPLIFQPGSKRDYSSYAYVLLSAVVQAAGQQPIAEQLSDRIVDPLKLDSFQLDVPFAGQKNWGKGYRLRGNQLVELNDYSHAWKHGAGAYKSNVRDFATFAIALMKPKLINRKAAKAMMTAQTTNDGKPTTMGLGVYVSGEGRSLKISHNGKQSETRTRMVAYPNQRHGIVVMCNGGHPDPGKITTAIYNALSKNGIKY